MYSFFQSLVFNLIAILATLEYLSWFLIRMLCNSTLPAGYAIITLKRGARVLVAGLNLFLVRCVVSCVTYRAERGCSLRAWVIGFALLVPNKNAMYASKSHVHAVRMPTLKRREGRKT